MGYEEMPGPKHVQSVNVSAQQRERYWHPKSGRHIQGDGTLCISGKVIPSREARRENIEDYTQRVGEISAQIIGMFEEISESASAEKPT